MGNAVYTDQLVCHDTIEACKASCSYECVFTDKCNGAANKYLCVPVDFRWLTWLIFGCFLIVVLCCSSLVACYACRAIRASVRNQQMHYPDRDVVFTNPGRVHHIHLDGSHRREHPPSRRY
ncbi:unnamed protein product [Cylicocyclus nassatus]|uniref:Uncharacterized protein n=1 Tax=Cylicocyclus nassatus TaxID=53992 RepID=A0AA36DU46_CYLNA|nr:unnamed protein product [Cylicocyclus nassatus]